MVRRSPLRTKPSASSFPPNEAEPATSRPPAPKTAMSQSPLDLRRALTMARERAVVRIRSRPLAEEARSRWHGLATELAAVTVWLAPADAARASEPRTAATAAPFLGQKPIGGRA